MKPNKIRVDVIANRKNISWSPKEQILRVLWAFASPFFSLSPRLFWFWRRFLLRIFGARIGKEVHIYPSVKVVMPWNLKIGDYVAIGDRAIIYALAPIELGERTTISQGVHLCAGSHDILEPQRPLMKIPIFIDKDVWVAADAFIGPGAQVGSGSVVGARSVVFKKIPSGWVYVGNPAVPIKKLNEKRDCGV